MLEQRIKKIIEPAINDLGFDLVRVYISGAAGSQTLQIMAEPTDRREMVVEDCEEISHTVSALLDVEDPIASHYALEVSSPGIDRPLVRLEDFDRFKGYEAKIELKEMIEGRRRARGILKGIEDNNVIIHVDNFEFAFPFDTLDKAKLILTDDLIKAAQKGNL